MPGKTWQSWNWAEEVLLPLLGALMWAAWAGLPVAALLSFATDFHTNPSGGPAVLLLLLGGTLVARLRGSRWVLLLAGLAAVLAAEWWLLFSPAYALWNPAWLAALVEQIGRLAPGPLLAAFIAALAWRQGTTANWKSHDELSRSFVIGVLMLGLGLVFTAYVAPAEGGRWGADAVQFVVASWAALSLAGVADASHLAASGERPRLSRYWVLALVTVVGAIIALGLLLTSLLTPQTVAAWLAQLAPVGDLLRQALLDVLYVLTYLLFLVLTPLVELIRRLLGNHGAPDITPTNPFTNPPAPPPPAAPLSPLADAVARALSIVVVLLAIGLIVAWALRRQSDTDEAGVRENRELIWSWDLVRAQLADLLARRRRPPLFAGLVGDANDPLLWVRRAYRRVLGAALARGYARLPRQTPLDYLPILDRVWPAEAETLAALTAAYSAARYGQVPPTPQQIAALRAAVDRMAAEPKPPGSA